MTPFYRALWSSRRFCPRDALDITSYTFYGPLGLAGPTERADMGDVLARVPAISERCRGEILSRGINGRAGRLVSLQESGLNFP